MRGWRRSTLSAPWRGCPGPTSCSRTTEPRPTSMTPQLFPQPGPAGARPLQAAPTGARGPCSLMPPRTMTVPGMSGCSVETYSSAPAGRTSGAKFSGDAGPTHAQSFVMRRLSRRQLKPSDGNIASLRALSTAGSRLSAAALLAEETRYAVLRRPLVASGAAALRPDLHARADRAFHASASAMTARRHHVAECVSR